jgi:hypothetical protein
VDAAEAARVFSYLDEIDQLGEPATDDVTESRSDGSQKPRAVAAHESPGGRSR